MQIKRKCYKREIIKKKQTQQNFLTTSFFEGWLRKNGWNVIFDLYVLVFLRKWNITKCLITFYLSMVECLHQPVFILLLQEVFHSLELCKMLTHVRMKNHLDDQISKFTEISLLHVVENIAIMFLHHPFEKIWNLWIHI